MLRNRVGTNAAFRHHFLKSCNLHSISTCCALLSNFLWRLGGWGKPSERRRTFTSKRQFRAAVMPSPAPASTFSPTNLPSRAPTNPLLIPPPLPNPLLTQLISHSLPLQRS